MVGFPTEVDLAYGGIVLVDALAEALRSHTNLHDYLDEDNVPYWAGSADGDDTRRRTITALEEELAGSPTTRTQRDSNSFSNRQRRGQPGSGRPTWKSPSAPSPRRRGPSIPLYAPADIPDSFDPLDEDADELRTAAATSVAGGALSVATENPDWETAALEATHTQSRLGVAAGGRGRAAEQPRARARAQLSWHSFLAFSSH